MKDARVEDYLKTIGVLKVEYKDKIEIYTGLEVDFIKNDTRKIFEKYKVDYTIGAVNLLCRLMILLLRIYKKPIAKPCFLGLYRLVKNFWVY